MLELERAEIKLRHVRCALRQQCCLALSMICPLAAAAQGSMLARAGNSLRSLDRGRERAKRLFRRSPKPPRTRNAETRPRRGKTSLRGSWQRARAAANPRLFLDIGDVEGPDRGVVAASPACVVGHAEPRPVRLPRRPRGL